MNESAENYLETILMLQQERINVRAIDVANSLGFSKPSVSRGIHLLEENGLLEIKKGVLLLTKEGMKKAKAVLERHETITRFLMMTTCAEKEFAEEDACRMEHFLSDQVYKGIVNFIKQVEEYNK